MQYKQDLEKEIAKFCDNKVTFKLVDTITESELDRQLQSLGTNVQFEK